MILYKTRRFAALLLAALSLTMSACGTGDGSVDPSPTAGEPSSPTQKAQSDPPGEIPSYSTDPTPSVSPSQSGDPSPSQSEDPSPSQSGSPSPTPSETPAGMMQEGEDVGNEWFADAVFVGDSRTDGLRLYSGIKGAKFICHTGLSVFTVGKNACIKDADGSKITAMDALAREQYAKVYLMLGVNELGYSVNAFRKAYTEVVEEIKTIQPAAAIYLQTLIPVNEPIAYEHGTNRAINNEKLKQFNEVITGIAQDENVCLVDVDTPFWSADGCLAAENTGDGVHLTKAGYQSWYAYLRTHTGNGVISEPGTDTEISSGSWDDVTPDDAPPDDAPPDDAQADDTQTEQLPA